MGYQPEVKQGYQIIGTEGSLQHFVVEPLPSVVEQR
jgi:hypothetical protein